jgi:glycosyltransferase involved in cell wall biosynthesis
MLLAVQFARFGPYHFTRLGSAVEALGQCGWSVRGLQTASSDATYGWNQGDQADLVTVFPGRVYEEISATELRRGVFETLDRLRPDAIAIAGWGFADARACLDWCRCNSAHAILMSETRAADGRRVWWKEWLKSRIVRRFDSALVGGRSHADYLVRLGMNRERIATGYDVVDNRCFASKAEEIRNAKCEHVPAGAGQIAPANAGPEGRYSRERERQIRNVTEHVTRHSLPVPPTANCQLPTGFAPFFLASNRFVERKNLARLIDAYAGYVRSIQHSVVSIQGRGDSGGISTSVWPLVLLGDGPLRADLIARCKTHGLAIAEGAPWQQLTTDNCQPSTVSGTPTVFFPGFRQIEELPQFYARAGCFVHPALEEPWGLVLNEAAASGLPILAGDNVGAAEELVEDGVNGWIFDAQSVDSISETLKKMATLSPDERDHMGKESFRILQERVPTKAFGEGLAKLLGVK